MVFRKITYALICVSFATGCKIIYDLISKSKKNEIARVLYFRDKCRTCGNVLNKFKKPEKPCCAGLLSSLVSYLDTAQQSLDLCMYIVTCRELTDAVLRAKFRGVVVRVILDDEMALASGSSAKQISQNGIPIRSTKTSKMHMKYCVIDSERRSRELGLARGSPLLLFGTFNWTTQASRGNTEVVMVVSDPDAVRLTQNVFSEIWDFSSDIMLGKTVPQSNS